MWNRRLKTKNTNKIWQNKPDVMVSMVHHKNWCQGSPMDEIVPLFCIPV